MTQQELAANVGIPQPTIARIERGTVLPRTATLVTLLEATGHRLAVEPAEPAVDREAIRRRLAMEIPSRTRSAIGRAASSPDRSPIKIVRRLRRFGVPLVLVGELAEIAHGSPARMGRTIEICHASTDVARRRVGLALDDLGATAVDELAFETDAGRLRLLPETAAGDDYDVLSRNAIRMPVDSGILVPVAALDDLIRARRARSTPEDAEAAAVLGAIAAIAGER